MLPGFRWQPQIDLLHGDATWNRADKIAEVAADAFRFVHAGNAGERSGVRFPVVCVRVVI